MNSTQAHAYFGVPSYCSVYSIWCISCYVRNRIFDKGVRLKKTIFKNHPDRLLRYVRYARISCDLRTENNDDRSVNSRSEVILLVWLFTGRGNRKLKNGPRTAFVWTSAFSLYHAKTVHFRDKNNTYVVYGDTISCFRPCVSEYRRALWMYHIGVTVTEKRQPEKKLIWVSVCVSNELRTLCRCCRVVRLTFTVQKRSRSSTKRHASTRTNLMYELHGRTSGQLYKTQKNTLFKCLEPVCFGYVTVFIPILGTRYTVHDTCLRRRSRLFDRPPLSAIVVPSTFYRTWRDC